MPNKFEDSKGRTVTVVNVENNIAQLNNGDRVAVERLNNPKYFKPVLESNNNPVISNNAPTNNIMNNKSSRYEDMFNSLQNGSTKEVSIGEDSNESINNSQYTGSSYAPSSEVKMSGTIVESHRDNLKELGADERSIPDIDPVVDTYIPNNRPTTEEDLIRKYQGHGIQTNTKLNKLAGEPVIDPNKKPQAGTMDSYVSNSSISQAQTQTHANPITESPMIESEQPVHAMFDKAKRVHSINVNLKISDKIPDKNVIKMLEENFDDSAIDYYTTEVFKKLMSNPRIIEDQVRQTIEKYVNGRAKPKTKAKAKPKAKIKSDTK